MPQIFNRLFLFVIVVSLGSTAMAQPPGSRPDSSRRTGGPVSSTGPRAYKDVITSKAVSDAGLFWVHKVEDKYFFEIPDSLFNRDILVVNRISKAAAGMRSGGFFGYGGDQIGQNVIRFEKGPANKVFLL